MFLHTLNSILTPPPNPLNINIMRQIPMISLLLPKVVTKFVLQYLKRYHLQDA